MEVGFYFELSRGCNEYWFAFCYPWSYQQNQVRVGLSGLKALVVTETTRKVAYKSD